LKKQNIYNLGKSLGLSRCEINNVLKNKPTIRNIEDCEITVMFSDDYKSGTTYRTISTRELYKAGTHYGTISIQDLIK
jgi:hypothetical protein